MGTGCRISTNFKRPELALVEQFRGLPVAVLDDCMGRMAAVQAAIRPVGRTALLGTAFTVRVPAGDNLMFHKAMDLAMPGDVVVIDAEGGTQRAIFGEIMVTWCIMRGLAGVVVDGCIRDHDALAKMDFPVFARGITPNGPYKNGPGEIGFPVSFGGQMVYPGDIVVGDGDGLIFVQPNDAPALLEQAEIVAKKEENILDTMRVGNIYLRPWVDEKLREIGCEMT